jgi:hypothetical protein
MLTIIEPNRPALLAEITTVLEQAGVNVGSIDADAAGERAIIRLCAEPLDRCRETLLEAGFEVLSADHLLVRIEDQPGVLADLSRRLANEEIDIRSIHVLDKDNAHAILALDTDNPFRAGQLLQDVTISEWR